MSERGELIKAADVMFNEITKARTYDIILAVRAKDICFTLNPGITKERAVKTLEMALAAIRSDPNIK